jgi:autotransporter-associated beta strand protein
MKTTLASSGHPFGARLVRSLSRTIPIVPSSTAAALALSLFSASTAQAEVIAGIDSWSSASAPAVSVTATGISATAATTGGWVNNENTDSGRGASNDTTWGTSSGPPPATAAIAPNGNLSLTNGKTDGDLTLTITNNSGSDYDLSAFHFDAVRFRPNAAKDYTLEVLEGSDITVGIVVESAGPITNLAGALSGNDQHDDIDIDLTGLADHTLEDGGVAIIRLAFSGGTGAGSGHHLFLDNVAVTAEVVSDNKFVITSVPASATAGSDFSVTVQAQDSVGAPFNVVQDTQIILGASGSGTISGNTATILSGTDSVTLNTVQYTKAEAITLLASRASGDVIASSAPSSSININAGAASQLLVETAADGSGIPLANRTVFPPNSITVYAISRDSFDNFVANETATWSLANITGNIVSGDLVDNTDGSATFTANDLGTANIRASFSGLPDADSGLITVEEFFHRYTGLGNIGGWNVAGNWTSSILPAFNNTTDLFFSAPANTRGSPYLGADYTVRSITFDTTSTANLNISYVLPGNLLPANLTMDTDSATEPAEINVGAAFTGTATLGFTPTTEAGRGVMILADDLLVTHDGSGNLVMNGDITQTGGSHGLTKAGPGTLILSGTNSYTGGTVVSGGVLVVNGTSLADSGKLTINGGTVDVTGTEVVAELDFGSGPVAEGTYGATGSGADTIDDVHFTGTGVVSVVPFVSGYSTWATANVGGQTADQDFNLDGVDNGIAYFMNDTGVISLPGIVGGAVTWSNGGNIPSSAYGTEFVVETSQDLVIWTPVEAVDLTTNSDTTLTYTLPTGQGKWFVRLEVTPN